MKKKIIVIPDSFKGSMTSGEVASIIAEAIKEKCGYEVVQIPIADGGEGSIDCILQSTGGEKCAIYVQSPEWKLIRAAYGITTDCRAVIEIAESSGITKQTSFQATKATTYGFGELIKAALDQGFRDFLICLGGSATTDCGCGMAAALGVLFYNQDGKSFVPTGESLIDVVKIDVGQMDVRMKDSRFIVMSDVENPLYGEMGAAYVYGPQKGANTQDVLLMDKGLRHISKLIYEATGVDCNRVKGAGAAGGTGYGCVAFLNAKIESGIEAMLRICHFDELVIDCDMIVTGEGCLDEQSLMGKVLSGIKKHAQGKRIVSFCGSCKAEKELLCSQGIDVIEIGTGINLDEAVKNGKKYLQIAVEKFFEEL